MSPLNCFSVSFETVTPESAEDGCAEDHGFVAEDVSLREAIDLVGGSACEANEFPVVSPRWFTTYEYDQNYATGETEKRSLHLPLKMTDASRMRVARLLGVS